MGLSWRAKTLCPLGFPSIVKPRMGHVLKPTIRQRATPFGGTKMGKRNRTLLLFYWTNFLLQSLRCNKLFFVLLLTKKSRILVCTKIQISSLHLTVHVAVDLKGKRMKFLLLLSVATDVLMPWNLFLKKSRFWKRFARILQFPIFGKRLQRNIFANCGFTMKRT